MRKNHKILAQALSDVFIPEILSELDLCETEYELSTEFEAKMDKLIRKEKKFYYPIIKTTYRKALTIALTALVMLSAMCMSVSAVRDTVFDIVVKVFDTHTEKIIPEETPVTESTVTTSTAPVTTLMLTSEASLMSETKTEQTTTAITSTTVLSISTFITETSVPPETTRIIETVEKGFYQMSRYEQTKPEKTYFCMDNKTVSPDKIKEKCSDGKIIIYDRDRTYENCSAYSIKGFSEQFAIAVKPERCSEYLLYLRSGGKPVEATLGDMINDLNLREIMTLNYARCTLKYISDDSTEESCYTEERYYNIDDDFLWNVLLADTDAKVKKHLTWPETGKFTFAVNVHLSFYDYVDFFIGVSPDGYVCTNLCSGEYWYDIGKDRAQEIIDYAMNNYSYDTGDYPDREHYQTEIPMIVESTVEEVIK